VILREYIRVDAGIQEAMEGGVLAATARRHAGHLTSSARTTTSTRARCIQDRRFNGFKKAVGRRSRCCWSDLAVEVVTPEDFMATSSATSLLDVVRVEGMEQRGTSHVVRSQVPLGEMFGYATDLRSRTQGRATYTMQFDSYQQVPSRLPKKSSSAYAANRPADQEQGNSDGEGEFERTKPHLNIGTIGHIDHGRPP